MNDRVCWFDKFREADSGEKTNGRDSNLVSRSGIFFFLFVIPWIKINPGKISLQKKEDCVSHRYSRKEIERKTLGIVN